MDPTIAFDGACDCHVHIYEPGYALAGKFLAPTTPQDDCFLALRRVLDGGRCWVKLAAPYETSRSGAPGYGDVAPLARVLASEHAERCVWASNWPHPNVLPAPGNVALRDWALDCIGDAERARRIFVDNPAALYGFGPD